MLKFGFTINFFVYNFTFDRNNTWDRLIISRFFNFINFSGFRYHFFTWISISWCCWFINNFVSNWLVKLIFLNYGFKSGFLITISRRIYFNSFARGWSVHLISFYWHWFFRIFGNTSFWLIWILWHSSFSWRWLWISW